MLSKTTLIDSIPNLHLAEKMKCILPFVTLVILLILRHKLRPRLLCPVWPNYCYQLFDQLLRPYEGTFSCLSPFSAGNDVIMSINLFMAKYDPHIVELRIQVFIYREIFCINNEFRSDIMHHPKALSQAMPFQQSCSAISNDTF